jgi:FAD:protein FMN transferase
MISVAKLFLSVLLLMSWSCTRDQAIELKEFDGFTMGSTYRVIYLPGPKTPSHPEVRAYVDRRLVELNQSISTYVKNSEISEINRDQEGLWHSPSLEFFQGLEVARHVWQATEGLYDPTVMPLVNLWGFGPQGPRSTPPEASQIAKARELVGLDKLELDLERGRLRKTVPGMSLDFSSLGQGMGIDMIREILETMGVGSYLINIAGEFQSRGQKPDGPWRVAIEAPHRERGVVQRVIEANNLAICTSGNYRQFFEAEGKRYAHTIDPKTGIPVQHRLISVTVANTEFSATTADAWATALLSAGPIQGPVLAETHGLLAYFIVENDEGQGEKFSEIFSSRWVEHFPESVVENL